jgi:hypothetical protein
MTAITDSKLSWRSLLMLILFWSLLHVTLDCVVDAKLNFEDGCSYSSVSFYDGVMFSNIWS